NPLGVHVHRRDCPRPLHPGRRGFLAIRHQGPGSAGREPSRRMNVYRLLIAVVLLGATVTCSQPPADPKDVHATLCFLTAPGVCENNVMLPLDPADNLAFQVQITATIPNLLGTAKAHVSLLNAAGAGTSSTVVDTIVTLEPPGEPAVPGTLVAT